MSGLGVVQTNSGKVSGVPLRGKYEGITQFKGIPYAAPPVGDLRWKPPVDPEGWEGIRICDAWPPVAIQHFTTVEPYITDFFYGGNPPAGEDCLYLNVTTGATDANFTENTRRPVYMWFHGGGLANGYPYEVEFDASELARKGVVVVSVAQRLNVFGYLALPQLTSEQGKSGNYGLMDQLKALEWVYKNISAFGGDPGNITVGGQSGGSTKACAMAFTPVSTGRVRRVILESGLKWMQKFPTLEESEARGRDYLKAIGIDPEASLASLRAMDPMLFLPTEAGTAGAPRPASPGEMVWDGELIPYQHTRENILHYMQEIDILCGTNLGEASLLGIRGSSDVKNAEEFYAHFRGLLGELYEKYNFDSLVSVTEENAAYIARVLATRGLCPAGGVNYSRNLMVDRLVGRLLQERYPHNHVYSYLFSHLLPWREEDLGTVRDPKNLMAYHSSELFFTFASLREDVPPARPWQPIDFELADMISSYWANFLHSGDPNGPDLPEWPASDESYGYMELGDEPLGHTGLEGPLEQLIAEYVSKEYRIDTDET